MAKWKNEGNAAVVVMHKLVLPGETVEVPEKMLMVLPSPLAEDLPPQDRPAGADPSRGGKGEKATKKADKATEKDPAPAPALTPDPSPISENGEGEEAGEQ